MGNWTTVNIAGTCPDSELPQLRDFVNGYIRKKDFDLFHCLCNTGGLAGLGDWAALEINTSGNLAERDYSVGSVAEELQKIGELCPNADIRIHVGDQYESLNCITTVHLQNGEVEIKEPEVKNLNGIDTVKINANLLNALRR